jgi:hypothetical protein
MDHLATRRRTPGAISHVYGGALLEARRATGRAPASQFGTVTGDA